MLNKKATETCEKRSLSVRLQYEWLLFNILLNGLLFELVQKFIAEVETHEACQFERKYLMIPSPSQKNKHEFSVYCMQNEFKKMPS